jgi:protein-tyrosine kinase
MNRLEEALRRAREEQQSSSPTLTTNRPALEAVVAADTPHVDAASATNALEWDLAPEAAPPDASDASSAPAESPSSPVESDRPESAADWMYNPALTGKVITSDQVRTISVEQYRRLAAILHQAQLDTGIKVIMIASALAGEGKTLTAINVALTLSQSYARKVLLIDADFRRPTLHNVFKIPNGSGLNDALRAGADRKLTLMEMSPTLSVIPAGRPDPDPMSALTSGRMKRIIQEAAGKFDWVVIDTPPIGLLTDAHLLAAMIDAAVLVVRAGRTPHAMIQRAIQSLGRDRVIGVVLNCVDDRASVPGGKYGGYYDSYYYTDRRSNGDGETTPRAPERRGQTP